MLPQPAAVAKVKSLLANESNQRESDSMTKANDFQRLLPGGWKIQTKTSKSKFSTRKRRVTFYLSPTQELANSVRDAEIASGAAAAAAAALAARGIRRKALLPLNDQNLTQLKEKAKKTAATETAKPTTTSSSQSLILSPPSLGIHSAPLPRQRWKALQFHSRSRKLC